MAEEPQSMNGIYKGMKKLLFVLAGGSTGV
jgi:hypothetical protein